MYVYGGHNFVASADHSLSVTIPQEVANRTAWFIYMTAAPYGFVYSIPGYGNGGVSEYRVYQGYTSGKAVFNVKRASGPGETYAGFRIIGIETNETVTGGKSGRLPDINFNDYQVVMDYYGLKD